MMKFIVAFLLVFTFSCTNIAKLNSNFINNIKSGKEIDVDKFIAKGGDINALDDSGKSALHYAVIENELEYTEKLLNAGANINILDSKGDTPLILAVEEENEEIVEFLLSKNADYKIENSTGNTALYFAITEDNTQIIKLLIVEGADFLRDDIFAYLTSRTSPAQIEFLVSKGMMINDLTENGNSLLHHALESNNINIIKFLIDNNLDVNNQNNQGNTPLHLKVDYDLAKLLILAGADLKVKNKKSQTIYHIYADDCNILAMLLANSPDLGDVLNSQDIDGNTVLHSVNDDACLELLIAANVDPNIKNDAGFTAAYKAETDKLITLLKAGLDINNLHDDENDSVFNYLVKIHFSETDFLGKLIAQYKPNINHKNKQNITPIIYVAMQNSFWFSDEMKSSSLKLFIDNGAELNIVDKIGGYNALHYTASLLNYDSSKLLLEAGIDPMQLSSLSNSTADVVASNARGGDYTDRQKLAKLIKSYQPQPE